MKKYIVILGLLLWSSGISFAQVKILESYDFTKPGYTLVGVVNDKDTLSGFDPGNFYIDDITVLNRLKDSWYFAPGAIKPNCAPAINYWFYITKDGKEEARMILNSQCDILFTEKDLYAFNKSTLLDVRNSLKPAVFRTEQFATIREARASWKKYSSQKKLVYIDTPEWKRYEGQFRFVYPCTKEANCLQRSETIKKELIQAIQKAYPKEPFKINMINGMQSGDLVITVFSTRALSDRFKLYAKGDIIWKPFELELRSAWKP
ncbi:hypothetical protein DBR32_00170 [Taibaiella sp. KBW10]|uniref:hypothetical protein n=1 Tax=Taibaiella sp. KBW10 TaxID=2153357 RepID=UPI000F5A9BC0|nr:hypothetical protein [Taibaiella sp. KBW10]RQO32067.1 hypothetical protein DBR32_00170 [Taibaiella sp. KBW10]